MKISLLILLSLFTVSLANAHPNHMTFEEVQHHKTVSDKNASRISGKLNHTIENGHNEPTPCAKQVIEPQHKTIPCKKK